MQSTIEERIVVIFVNLMSNQWSMLSRGNASSVGFEFERSLMQAIEGRFSHFKLAHIKRSKHTD